MRVHVLQMEAFFGLGCEMGISTQKLHARVLWDWKNCVHINILSKEMDKLENREGKDKNLKI